MKIQTEILDLPLKTPFKLSNGVSHSRQNILVRVDEGLGEAALPPYYAETLQSVQACFTQLETRLGDDPFRIDSLLELFPVEAPSARSAFDVALHDLIGKRLGIPVYKLLGLNPKSVETSFTIAIDEPSVMAQKARVSNLPILKIKIGTPQDLEIVRSIRNSTSARLRLDANAAWSRDEAAQMIPRLEAFDLELIEQPIAREDREGFHWLKKRVKVPLFADESVQNEKDLLALAGGVDGVVVKVMKTGGLRGAIRMITLARALDLKVMLSCMIESSLGVTAAAHIASLADYVDLDGPLLIAKDRFAGIRYEGAKIVLPMGPGLGVAESRS